MTKLASSLPGGDANGLSALARQLIDSPHDVHVIVALVDCKKITTDNDNGEVIPTARIDVSRRSVSRTRRWRRRCSVALSKPGRVRRSCLSILRRISVRRSATSIPIPVKCCERLRLHRTRTMSGPYYADHDVTVHVGDSREVLATMEAGSVQCVVTSPPYFGLRDYGVDGQIGLESSPAEYVAEMVAVFRDVKRVLADDGVLWLNLGDSYSSKSKGSGGTAKVTLAGPATGSYFEPRKFHQDVPDKNLMGIPWRVAFILQDDGWTLRNAVIWHKPNAMPESVTDRLSCRYEHVFLFSKSRQYWFDLDAIRESYSDAGIARRAYAFHSNGNQGSSTNHLTDGGIVETNPLGKNPGDVWTIPTHPFPGAHFACMPPALAERCILTGCPEDGTVLDPFAGSGTTLMVARKLGRRSVGIELNPDYADIIVDRIGQTPFDFGAVS